MNMTLNRENTSPETEPKEYSLVVIKPDAVGNGDTQEIFNGLLDLSSVEYLGYTTLDREDLEMLYSENISKHYFEEVVRFFQEEPSFVVLLSGQDIINNLRRYKHDVRIPSRIALSDEDIVMLDSETHPRQDEITRSNAVRNLIHVCSSSEESLVQFDHLRKKYFPVFE